jgi:hypothetical protein
MQKPRLRPGLFFIDQRMTLALSTITENPPYPIALPADDDRAFTNYQG